MDDTEMQLTPEILAALSARFDPSEEQRRKGDREGTFYFTFIDARNVMDRLDSVVGPKNWADDFEPVPVPTGGIVVKCRLTVCGVTKCDMGEAEKEGEPWKSACSDALKRAAVHFGIGRYLYSKEQGNQQQAPRASQQGGPWPISQNTGPRPYNGQPAQNGGSQPSANATEPQIKAIFAIARGNAGMDDEQLDAYCMDRHGGRKPAELTRREASTFIDHLKQGALNHAS